MLALTQLSYTKVPDGDRFVWDLKFSDMAGKPQYASEAYIRTLLERDFRAAMPKDVTILCRFGCKASANRSMAGIRR